MLLDLKETLFKEGELISPSTSMNEIEIQRRILNASSSLGRLKSLVIAASKDQPGYYNANEALLNLYPEIRQAVLARIGYRVKLSSGISTLPTMEEFITQAQKGIAQLNYYVNYSAPSGTYSAQEALRRYESALLTSDEVVYPPRCIFITSGGTGAINLALEYVKQTFPSGRILMPGLSYYVFQFIADRLGIPCDILLTDPLQLSDETRFLPTPEEIRRSIAADTKFLVITQPSNPTGEYYTHEEIAAIIDVAVEKDLLILSDAIFADLVYNTEDFTTVEEVAFAKGALERILTVRSYSKNYNLAGLRIGYLATSNPHIGHILSFINERIMCCPPTIYTDLINLISLLQNIAIETRRSRDKPVSDVIKNLAARYEIGQGPNATADIERVYLRYCDFMHSNLSFYGHSFDVALETLGDNAEASCQKKAAFNTLVKVKGIASNINFFDFCLNLYLTTGIETQIGPCFGLGQRTWEEHLGFWLRITHTLMPGELQEALRTFLIFRDIYIENPVLFLHTGLEF